jgi:hypothetical protein
MEKTNLDFTPHRLENETYEEYKNRRKVCKMFEKQKLKGYKFWDSSKRGTYTKEKEQQLLDEIQRDKKHTKKSHKE